MLPPKKNPPLAQVTEQLQGRLSPRLERGERIVVAGIGSELRGDDAAGVLVARQVSARRHPQVFGMEGGAAPENITGSIIECRPSMVIFVDAADLGLEPGEARMIGIEEITGVSFSTHSLPLKVVVDYLASRLNCEFLVLGIQPAHVDFARKPSAAVQNTVLKLAAVLCGA